MKEKYFEDVYFIIGYERSGTTMLRNILSNSSEMNVHGIEPHYILEMYKIFGLRIININEAVLFLYNHPKYPQPNSNSHPAAKERLELELLQSLYGGLTEIHLGEFFLMFYHRLYKDALKSKLLLKHPELALHLETLQTIFPNVKVINMIRDPRSAIASSYARWPSHSFTFRCNKWINAIKLPRNWAKQNQNAYLEVIYEDLISDFKETLKRVCSYLQIVLEEPLLNFHYKQGQWLINKEYEEREFKGVDTTKLESWKKQLNVEQILLIEGSCRRWMIKYNYPLSKNSLKPKGILFILKDKARYISELLKNKYLVKIRSFITEGS